VDARIALREQFMSGTNFFDFREKLTTPKRAPQPPASAPAPTNTAAPTARPAPKPLTVSQLTDRIDHVLQLGVPGHVLVQGEVSNFNHHRGSGHWYFTLKDAKACIDCVMFRSDVARMKFVPEDGMELIARGEVKVYAQRGRYQLYTVALHPLGTGALEVAFQQLRTRLESEGLFAPQRKKPIPPYPRRIALVTSRQTAALQDMLKVLRRFAWLKLCVYHVPVQGDGAAEQIAAALNHLGKTGQQSQIDLILLARGGGSLEDLWEFNEECVARAIAACPIPVITGVGHEVDTSIADLVADYHAHTPTEAAQIVVAHWKAARELIDVTGARMRRAIRAMLHDARQRVANVERHAIFRRPTERINLLRQMLDDRQRALVLALGHRLRREQARVERLGVKLLECHTRHAIGMGRQRITLLEARFRASMLALQSRRAMRVEAMEKQLEALSPRRVLERGYSVTIHKKRGAPVRSASELRPGDRIISQFAEGSVESTVDDANQPRLFE
jgi:exodeoxyribonuclease VII large subunit